ncbi:MAG TPA: beta-propeller domain-containing protein, partial [Candidatus Anammoximicrobium sp.]|nr:beta-propeller domain-containing protein [Candidatus Anammoximicrobium sp.]
MASTPRRKRRRFGKLTFESLEPRVVLDAQLGALFADGSIAPVITDGDQLSASEVARAESQFVRFTSADELKQFLAEDADKRYADLFGREAWRWWYPTYVTNVDGDLMLVRTDAMVTANAASGSDYSTTNIQVAGVDEGDLIKTDGRYLYIGREQDVTIVDVQAADKMRVLSRLSGQGTTSALYLSEDRLTVISQDSAVFGDPMPMIASDAPLSRRSWGGEPKFLVTVYDVSAPETPELISRLEIEGSYVDSRMIGDTVFLVSSHQFQLPAPEVVPANPDPILPGSDEAWRLAAGSNEAAISILPWPGPD